MSKCKRVKMLIEELFSDGKVHSIEEITLLAIEKKIVLNKKDSAVKNALYQMKQVNTNLVSVDKGTYRMLSSEDGNVIKQDNAFENALEIVLAEVCKLRNFDWINCTDDELVQAREKIAKLKNVFGDVQKLIR